MIVKGKKLEDIKKIWEKKGWKYEDIEDGIKFSIEFPFDKFTRIINVYFMTKPKNYYYIEVKLASEDKKDFAYENLYVEITEHMMIHKTLWKLGWIEPYDKRREKDSSKFNDRK